VKGMIRVNKPAGQKSVQGAFVLKASDSHAAEGQTLVTMKRTKVRSLTSVRYYADPGCRGVYCIGGLSGGQLCAIERSRGGSSRGIHRSGGERTLLDG